LKSQSVLNKFSEIPENPLDLDSFNSDNFLRKSAKFPERSDELQE